MEKPKRTFKSNPKVSEGTKEKTKKTIVAIINKKPIRIDDINKKIDCLLEIKKFKDYCIERLNNQEDLQFPTRNWEAGYLEGTEKAKQIIEDCYDKAH